MQRTTAVGSIGGQFVDRVASPFSPGTTIGATDLTAHQEEIVHVEEKAGLAPSGADLFQLSKAICKLIAERANGGAGGLFFKLDYQPTVPWADNPDTYFPAVCLNNIAATLILNQANYPDAAPYLRGYMATYARGMAGETSAYQVTNWAIAANVATITLANNAANLAILNALQEEVYANGSAYGIPINVPATGNISTGDYIPTGVDTVNRLITFACVAANGSGAVSSTVSVYPFRVVGQPTQAKILPMQGLTLHAANDANGYMLGGMRRRGFSQGHLHNSILSSPSGFGIAAIAGANTAGGAAGFVSNPISDGISGPPRIAKETHGPLLAGFLYLQLGRAS